MAASLEVIDNCKDLVRHRSMRRGEDDSRRMLEGEAVEGGWKMAKGVRC
jgi:hypothetical protein